MKGTTPRTMGNPTPSTMEQHRVQCDYLVPTASTMGVPTANTMAVPTADIWDLMDI